MHSSSQPSNPPSREYAIALTIAGSDSGGGAGIQADLKAFSALGVYGASVITAVTAQNTLEVRAVHEIPTDMVRAQIDTVLADLEVAAIKIGMLSSSAIIEAVAAAIADYPGPVVLDPVMVAKSGDHLLRQDAIDTLRNTLLPHATLITPNLPEAAVLLGCETASDASSAAAQGTALRELGAQAVLMKGGHATGEECVDQLIHDAAPLVLRAPRLDTRCTHGTGCTLSAAIAARLARGDTLAGAVRTAHSYLQGALAGAERLRVGSGHGPVHHFHALWKTPS